ncbi:ribosome maturation factor RimM [Candidatus Odyssella acanthamoebae]|uniref:ribosome maturation factor RimM n=1 Tax=Candidatus Odyssella acanthamoebae TaxID=91604 RepID=UPI00068B947B|nr:ribosome maturation factor RimM [Candidatus Paracaedibacter acanthamoebae]
MTKNSRITDLSLKNPVCLAEITSPHGIRGAVKVKTFTEYSEDVFDYPTLRDQAGHLYKLNLFAPKHNDLLVVTIDGVSSRDDAESLRGTKLYVDRSELPETDDNEFYYEDLVGLNVIDQSGEDIGTVLAVQNYGAGDFFDIKTPESEIYTLPFTQEAVPQVDIKAKKIIINKEYLLGGK